jgi:hypothetical protein
VKEVTIIEGAPISVVTHFPIMRDVREDPIATTMVISMFMNTNVDNIRILFQKNKEKEARIKKLEEKLQQVKIEERSLQSFKISVVKVMNE